MRKSLPVAAVALASVASFGTPAGAAGVSECTSVGTATFSPALTTTFQSGTITFDYDYTCVGVDGSGGSGVQAGHHTLTYAYSGSCVTAAISEPGINGVLVGGLTGASYSASARIGVRVFVLVPTNQLGNPCNMRTAVFANTGPDVI